MHGGSGNDLISGGFGDDVISGDSGADEIWGGIGFSPHADEVEEVGCFGGCFTDNDTLNGGTGNDWIIDFFGWNTADGGTNNDVVNADWWVFWERYHDFDELASIAGFCDVSIGGCIDGSELDGGSGNDWVFGGWGDDLVKGNSGNDHLSSGGGKDTLNGGSGTDACTTTPDHDTTISCETVEEEEPI
jgi:Ca2+-binding RTX toxin-like protein